MRSGQPPHTPSYLSPCRPVPSSFISDCSDHARTSKPHRLRHIDRTVLVLLNEEQGGLGSVQTIPKQHTSSSSVPPSVFFVQDYGQVDVPASVRLDCFTNKPTSPILVRRPGHNPERRTRTTEADVSQPINNNVQINQCVTTLDEARTDEPHRFGDIDRTVLLNEEHGGLTQYQDNGTTNIPPQHPAIRRPGHTPERTRTTRKSVKKDPNGSTRITSQHSERTGAPSASSPSAGSNTSSCA